MNPLHTFFRRYFCKHTFLTLHTYDKDTCKVYCSKCESKYIVNTHYGWKFHLRAQTEKEYDELQKEMKAFDAQFLVSSPANREDIYDLKDGHPIKDTF